MGTRPTVSRVKRVVIYTRISRDDTGDNAKTARQEKTCRALCEARGWEVVAVENDESISAYSGKDRPGWNEVLRMINDGEVDVVVAWHIDRMTRSMTDLENLIVLAEANDVGVATATGDIDLTTDVGRMVARILAAVARQEVERKSARQRHANSARAYSGIAWKAGPRPFGYEEDRVTIREDEARYLREAAVDLLGGWSLSAIARRWTDEGVVGNALNEKNKGIWNGSTVRRLLLNPRYVGLRTYNGEVVGEAEWEPLFTQEMHDALAAKLGDPARGDGSKTGRMPRTLLSGLARCAACDNTVTASGTHKVPSYRCRHNFCVTVPRDRADEWVLARCAEAIAEGGMPSAAVEDRDAIKAEIAELQDRQTFMAQQVALGNLDKETWLEASVPSRKRLQELTASLVVVPITDYREFDNKSSAEIYTAVTGWPLERQRELVDRLVDVSLVGGVITGRGAAKVHIKERVLVTAAAG